ncbi:hypothetical protein A3Q56_02524 [Intoshia linei]|uniref:Uncharacterized protein n=1 Tax=Intoshia linei TaxID=1819745 RepID=A0A177B5Y2_9BILA|nr:hypothetical protein A3Q56_02524 [Intoshia linei]
MKSNEASTLNKLDYTFCKGTKLEFCQNFRQKCTKTRICIILIGIISRVGFSEISKIYDFTQVYELITPYNSAINVEEGIALKNAGICCYSVEFIHVMIDILCAVLVGYLVKFNLNSCQKKFKSKANCDVSDYFKKESTIDNDYLVDISIALYYNSAGIPRKCD